ncbi:MAG: hypothetical protein ACJAT2_000783 [Bacteriovoracaceae bacterium]|jgi:hypothetical protein
MELILGLISKLKTILFSISLFLNGCFFKSEEAVLIDTLKNKYSNLKVNKAHKDQVIASIEALSKDKKLKDHLPLYQSLIQKMGDGHLVLEEKKDFKEEYFQVELNIQKKVFAKIPGEVEFKEVLKIDSLPVEKWVEKHSHFISASSVHGKRYRTLKMIESRKEGLFNVESLSLKDDSLLRLEKKKKPSKQPCVSGYPYNEKSYVIKVNSFWCEGKSDKRKEVFQNFKKPLDRQIKAAGPYEKIILDLRDNGGGADDEVRYLLGHMISKKAYLYSFQFVGKKKITEYIEPLPTSLGHKIITVLINGGCFSACEVVAGVLKDSESRNLVGERTHGGAGDPLKEEFSNSVLTYPSCLVWRKNGSLYEGVGVMPTVMGESNSLKRASLLD